jgi:hypothetical protein
MERLDSYGPLGGFRSGTDRLQLVDERRSRLSAFWGFIAAARNRKNVPVRSWPQQSGCVRPEGHSASLPQNDNRTRRLRSPTANGPAADGVGHTAD